MRDSGLPRDVERFIIDHIETVEMLSVLLLLYADPNRSWSAVEVGTESRTNEWSAQMHLEDLFRRGLLRSEGEQPARFQFETRFSTIVDTVARTYRERRAAVITTIYTKPDEPLPPDPIQAFADAFKLKKDK